MSTDEVTSLLSDRQMDNDTKVLEGYSFDNLDMDSVLDFQARIRNNFHFEQLANLPVEEFVRKIGAYASARDSSNNSFLTIGGLLFFGKYEAIVQRFPRFQLDYFDKGNSLSIQRYDDRVSTLTNRLNIWQFFNSVFPKIMATAKSKFELNDKMERVDDSNSLEVAVREALINTLMHANYYQGERTIITNYPNYYLFENPGEMLVTPREFFTTFTSKARNSLISSWFVMLGLGERAGTGGGIIIQTAEKIRSRVPEIHSSTKGTSLRIWKVDYADSLEGQTVDDKARMIVKAVTKNGMLSKAEIIRITALTRSEVDTRLRKLTSEKIIMRHGQSRGTKYSVPMTPSQAIAQLDQTSDLLKKFYNETKF